MNIANKVSTFRILSVPFFISCMAYYAPERDYLRSIALFIFLLAVISDAIDGYLARKSKQKSNVGHMLDPLADKLLLISAFICLYLVKDFPAGVSFPLWVVLIVISRDAIILLGAIVIYMVRQKIDIWPTKWGKLTTVFQMSAALGVLMQFRFSYLLMIVAVIFTVVSGIDYIHRGFKVLYALDNNRDNS